MWVDPRSNCLDDESVAESDSSGEEIPIWIRGQQRWVSGVVGNTTCQDVITVLLQDEEIRVRQKQTNNSILFDDISVSGKTSGRSGPVSNHRKMARRRTAIRSASVHIRYLERLGHGATGSK